MSSGPQQFDKYELRTLLGRNDSAEVWKAFDSHLNRYVVLKILHANLQNDPEFVTHFQQQTQAIASLHHPNIVRIHDVRVLPVEPASNSLTAFIVMQYVEGASLANYIGNTSRNGKFPPVGDIIHLFASIASAIDYAHQSGVIHGGLRPDNILLDKNNTLQSPTGEPVLTDFGMSKLLGTSTILLDGSSIDTVAYVSPEQARGQPASRSSDIYALGVLLFEVCTGSLPFQGNNPSAIMQQYINATPTSPSLINPNVPPALATVILRGVAKDSAERFPSASSLVAAIAQAFNMPIPSLPIPTAGSSTSPIGSLDEPTYIMPSRSNPLVGAMSGAPINSLAPGTPSSPSLPLQIIKDSTPPPATFVSGAHPLTPQRSTTPPQGTKELERQADQSAVGGIGAIHRPLQQGGAINLAPTPVAPERRSRRRRGIAIALIALCAILLLGSVLGTLLLLSHNAAQASQIVGNAFFISSEQSNNSSAQGINDELLIKLNNISTPGAGKSYYAWLLSDKGKSPVSSVSLGIVKVNHGSASVPYSDPQHMNLLANYSRLLITEETANTILSDPSQDQHTWRYYAELSQITDSKDTVYHLSMLSHLRYLLAADPRLDEAGLPGGLDIGLYSQAGSVLTWAGSARDYWADKSASALGQMKSQFIRILDYIDGNTYVQADVPALSGTHPVADAPIGLLGPGVANSTSFTYVGEISGHLKAIAQASSTTPDQRKLATQLISAINNVQKELGLVHQDAKQLINMSSQQLRSQDALNMLNGMEVHALYAYVGQLDPVTNNTLQKGVIQIHQDIQRLAAFNITPYS